MHDRNPGHRTIPARLHTESGWITGTVHVPLLHGFLDFLNRGDPFLRLTHVTLPGAPDPLPFFAVRTSTIELVLPDADEQTLALAASDRPTDSRRVSCLLRLGAVRGTLEVPTLTRLSDFLMSQTGYFTVRNALLPEPEPLPPLVFVNTSRLIGISELSGA